MFDTDTTDDYVYTSHGTSEDTIKITYESLSKNGTKSVPCTRCSYSEQSSVEPIYTPKGYSVNDEGTGIAGGYLINNNALLEWQKYGGSQDVEFGILIFNPKYLGQDTFLDENGIINATQGAVQVNIESVEYSSFDFMINDFADTQSTLELVIAGYASYGGKYQLVQTEYDLSETPAVSKVSRGDDSLYTVTISSVKTKNSLSTLPDYIVPTKED